MPNTNYGVAGYTAFAIEQVLGRDWNDNVTKAFPLFAAIHDRDLHWNKGFEVKGTKVLVPIMNSLVTGMTTSNAGVADANEVPTAWPTYDATQGFTHAEYNLTHLFRTMTIRDSERVVAGGKNGERGNLIDGKVKQLMLTFKTVMSDMAAGSTVDSRTSLIGLDYVIATANVVGNIDQSTDATWRGSVQPATGTFSLPSIDNAFDSINQNDGEAPDLLLLGNPGGSATNCYGKIRSQIAPAERIVNAEFKARYGFANFVYMDMKAIQDNRAAAGTSKMLTTSSWLFGGPDKPKQGKTQRIAGSDAEEWAYTWWGFLGCKEVRRNHRWAGING